MRHARRSRTGKGGEEGEEKEGGRRMAGDDDRDAAQEERTSIRAHIACPITPLNGGGGIEHVMSSLRVVLSPCSLTLVVVVLEEKREKEEEGGGKKQGRR